jgi:hypothetical protein
MTVWGWVWTLIVLALPCIGFIMTLVWAFVDGNQSRQNFCRANLVLLALALVLYLILILFGFGPAIAESVRDQLRAS